MCGGEGGNDSRADPSINACLELLADRWRREILAFFLDSGRERASTEEVVSEIVNGRTDATGTGSDRDPTAAELHHVHLPMLAYARVLEYDIARHVIRYRGNARVEELYSKIRELQEPERLDGTRGRRRDRPSGTGLMSSDND